LDPLEVGVDGVGEGLHGERLGEAGDALHQQVPIAEHAHEEPVYEVVLPDDDAVDLVQDGGDEIAAPEHRIVDRGRAERTRHLRQIRG